MVDQIPVMVISLPEATERRGRLLDRLAALHISPVQVITAVRGAALAESTRQAVYDDDSMRCHAGRSMTDGELGCALSHQQCYEAFLASEAAWALILEDDAELPDDLGALIQALTSKAPAWQVDVFNLGPVRKFVHGDDQRVLNYRVVEPIRLWNAHAYLINRQAAQALRGLNSPVRYMADDWAAFREVAGLRLAALDPFACAQAVAVSASGLEQDRQQARKKRGLRLSRHQVSYLLMKLRRRWREFKQALGKAVRNH